MEDCPICHTSCPVKTGPGETRRFECLDCLVWWRRGLGVRQEVQALTESVMSKAFTTEGWWKAA